jgi:hypothetical protein
MRQIVGCCLIAVTLAGCTGDSSPFPTARVAGRITLDGALIESGNISMLPEGEAQARPTAVDFSSGQYTLGDAPLGKVRVFIIASRPTGRMVPGSSTEIPEVINIVPEAYRQGIVVDIAGDNNNLDFALTQHGGQL